MLACGCPSWADPVPSAVANVDLRNLPAGACINLPCEITKSFCDFKEMIGVIAHELMIRGSRFLKQFPQRLQIARWRHESRGLISKRLCLAKPRISKKNMLTPQVVKAHGSYLGQGLPFFTQTNRHRSIQPLVSSPWDSATMANSWLSFWSRFVRMVLSGIR